MAKEYSDLSKKDHIDLMFRWIKHLEGGYIKSFIEKIGINKATVSIWRTGRQAPGKDTIHLLQKAYDITPEQYYAGPEKYSKSTSTIVRSPHIIKLPSELSVKMEELAEEYGLSNVDELATCCCQMFALFEDGSRRAFLARWMEWRLQGLDKKPDPPREDSNPAPPTKYRAQISLSSSDRSDQ